MSDDRQAWITNEMKPMVEQLGTDKSRKARLGQKRHFELELTGEVDGGLAAMRSESHRFARHYKPREVAKAVRHAESEIDWLLAELERGPLTRQVEGSK